MPNLPLGHIAERAGSYHARIHNAIFSRALDVEKEKSRTRVPRPRAGVWTDQQLYLLHGAQLKIERLLLGNETDPVKVEDDLIDAYNYVALAFNSLRQQRRL